MKKKIFVLMLVLLLLPIISTAAVICANDMPGGDIGEKVNNAVTFLGNSGCITIKDGIYEIKTPINLPGGYVLKAETPVFGRDLNLDNKFGVVLWARSNAIVTLVGKGAVEIDGIFFKGSKTCYKAKGIVSSGYVRMVKIHDCGFAYLDKAIVLQESGQCSVIEHNTIRRVNIGILVGNADGTHITNNRIIDCKNCAIYLDSQGKYSIWITHNNFANAGNMYGDILTVDRGDLINFVSNHCETCIAKQDAVAIRSLPTSVVVQFNIRNNFFNFYGKPHAIYLEGTVLGLNITGNDFHNSDPSSIISAIHNDAKRISNGVIVGNLSYGACAKPIIDSTKGITFKSSNSY